MTAPLYPVASFFVTTIEGRVGLLVGIGQALCGKLSPYAHCGIVVSSSGDTVEGQPGGARFGHLDVYKAQGRPLLIGDAIPHWARARPGIDVAALREAVAVEADKLRGTPYSVLDYVALALLHLGLPSAWVRQRVETSGHLICSALCDLAFRRAGVHLFEDDRLPGDVMPADLAALAERWETPA